MAHKQLYDYEPKEPVLLGGTHSQFSTDGGTTWKVLRGAQEIGDIGDITKSAEARDTWSPYYEQILELDMKSKSDLEQLEMEYIRKLSEFNAVVTENKKISETEKNNALLIIEQDYQRQRA